MCTANLSQQRDVMAETSYLPCRWSKNSTLFKQMYPTESTLSQVSDSEHLLRLPELNNVAQQQVLILRGNGGRELIKDALVRRGAKVHYSETYKREFIPFDPVSCISLWKNLQINQIIVTSGEQLDYLCSQLTSEQLTWLNQQELYIPSQRIADIAIQRGFTRVRCTGSASNQELLAAL